MDVEVDGIDMFEEEVLALIHYHRLENNIPYAAYIGVLDICKHRLIDEALYEDDNEEGEKESWK